MTTSNVAEIWYVLETHSFHAMLNVERPRWVSSYSIIKYKWNIHSLISHNHNLWLLLYVQSMSMMVYGQRKIIHCLWLLSWPRLRPVLRCCRKKWGELNAQSYVKFPLVYCAVCEPEHWTVSSEQWSSDMSWTQILNGHIYADADSVQ